MNDSPGSVSTPGPVMFTFSLGLVGLGCWCNIQQLNTSHDAMYALFQTGVDVSKLSGTEALNFLTGNMSKFNQMAWLISFVCQGVFLTSFAFPMSRVQSLFHAKHGGVPSSKEIAFSYQIQKWVTLILFGLEILSDVVYSTFNTSIINGKVWTIVNFLNFGWLPSLMFVLCVSFGSTIIFKSGLQGVFGSLVLTKKTPASQPIK